MIKTEAMASKNRNKTLECYLQKENDHLKRHWLTKHKNFDFQVTTVARGFLNDKDSEPFSNEDLESDIVANDKLIDDKIRFGKKISKVIMDRNTQEEPMAKIRRSL